MREWIAVCIISLAGLVGCFLGISIEKEKQQVETKLERCRERVVEDSLMFDKFLGR